MSTAQQQQPIMGATSTAAVAVALVQPPQLKMFDFLVSYRGLAATSVIFQHLAYFSKSYDVMHGFYFGVVSFFALSAFLLTYRLITLYERAGSSLLRIAQITVNYSIMRFFRIYVTFFAFCIIYSMLEYTLLGERKHQLELIASLVTLGRGARYTNFKRHGYLWTIPVEIKYYFCIPPLAFAMCKLRQRWHLALVSAIAVAYSAHLWLHVDKTWARFNSSNKFANYVSVFLLGSLVAFIVKRVEDLELSAKCLHWSPRLVELAALVNVAMQVLGLRLPYELGVADYAKNGVFWSAHLLLMLLSAPNAFTRRLNDVRLMRMFGKYSFGIYLFHMFALRVVAANAWLFPTSSLKLAATFALTVPLAVLFYDLIEIRTIRLANKCNAYLAVHLFAKEAPPSLPSVSSIVSPPPLGDKFVTVQSGIV